MHRFHGKWITDEMFAPMRPRDVFQHGRKWLKSVSPEQENSHILFRRRFSAPKAQKAMLCFTADDYAKIYLNGDLIAMGPEPAYHFDLGYLAVDVTDALREGENVLAVHTYYQGLVNRQWQSGDCRHGLLLDLEIDGKCVLCTDESFLTARHGGYAVVGEYGYRTAFAESYDSRAAEVGFEQPDFDDSAWKPASVREYVDYTVTHRQKKMIDTETLLPVSREQKGNAVLLDFGGVRVGYLHASAKGERGSAIEVRCAQEKNDDGSIRWQLRASKCDYREPWLLSGGEDTLDWFDYKSFRYAEFILPDGCELGDVTLTVRRYPFRLRAALRSDLADDPKLRAVWELCVNTQRWGPQEVMHDCMERERGCYIADSVYTCLTHDLLTGDGSLFRKLLDDGFASARITQTLGCCTACSYVSNTAEYPLIFCRAPLWYYRLHGDKRQLAADYEKIKAVLDGYRRDYERDGLLCHMDKWCVVEWPKNYRDGYAVELPEHEICEQPHIALNAHYYEALRYANATASVLGLPPYRDAEPIRKATVDAFYDDGAHLFRDCEASDHTSYIGNIFALAYGLAPDDRFVRNTETMIAERKLSAVNIFGTFPILQYFTVTGQTDKLRDMLLDEGAYRNMIAEGADVTFEAWGKEKKWNTSLFHNTLSYAAAFMTDRDVSALFAL
ncbi:MAG: family 78 glycoside hydrolase catalytic domain [Oscillospiraceae bacterium]|nr:family 78 glycoside hydrolase catalytic domain [Oscillospiraceae bacterium]